MQPALADNSESQDGQQSREKSPNNDNNINLTNNKSGYYDAEKCRAHIANQIRVSKIDRFAAQVSKAIEVEAEVHSRLSNILNMFLKRSAQLANDFTLKCKLGLQRHRQDRILNQTKRKRAKIVLTRRRQSQQQLEQYSTTFTTTTMISNDLLYGEGAQLIHELLSQPMTSTNNHTQKQIKVNDCQPGTEPDINSTEDYSFEPSLYVRKLEDYIRTNLQRSNSITAQLSTIKQLFERLASEHRDKLDLVYAAEENRRSTTVVRRSAYNLSVAAIKATSTPVHVNSNSNESHQTHEERIN